MHDYQDTWVGRRVFVTGCTGFLGAAVTRELLDCGAVVVGLVNDRNGCSEYTNERASGRFFAAHGRVEDTNRLFSLFSVHEISAVFHLESSDQGGPSRTTDAVIRVAQKYHPRLPVIVSRPANQLRIAGGKERDGVPLRIARFEEVFGPGDRNLARIVPRTAIGLIANDVAANTEGPVRDFVYVVDAARACLALGDSVGASGEARDITFRSGWQMSDQEMAEALAASFRGMAPRFAHSSSSANQLNWRPHSLLATALNETIAWYRAFAQNQQLDSYKLGIRKVA